MTDELRQRVVDIHNKLRNRMAIGEEVNYKNTISNMKQISYDPELEKLAQCHANECIFSGQEVHDRCIRTGKFEFVGQNINIVSDVDFYDEWLRPNYTETMILSWYNEIVLTDRSNYASFTDKLKHDVDKDEQVGHFAQVVWGDTYKIGCARASGVTGDASHKHGLIFICNYAPGLMHGESVFEAGTPCSKCPKDFRCSTEYRGLCEDVKNDSSKVSCGFISMIVFIFGIFWLCDR